LIHFALASQFVNAGSIERFGIESVFNLGHAANANGK
jgi:hypothetical protein